MHHRRADIGGVGADVHEVRYFGDICLEVAAAKPLMDLSKRIGFRTALAEGEGCAQEYIGRVFSAARDPQLK